MIKWKKPNDAVVETNENPGTIEAAERLGWEREKCDTAEDKPAPKKRGRPKKAAD